MKYIIVGLGAFGGSLAEKLTLQGNEVIGVDRDMEKVEYFKEKVSHTICMDCTDELAVIGLPLEETDVSVITIGEDQGSNILTTALFKNLNAKRIISRANDHIHEKVLQAIGITEIVDPEEETAERWAKRLCLSDIVDSFELDSDYSIIEAKAPAEFNGKTIGDTKLMDKHNILVLTTIRKIESKGILTKNVLENKVQGVADSRMQIEKDDILVLFGSNKNLQNFLKQD